ncbi:hypothetical protein RJZ56_006898 [Blastomyces dermatitidis]|uniref:Uncharacterized protein n=1 Tax=Ajellomyces dermatitidis (strain ER-3 / ATCC MYA-2586) TaxID=559297 RepID=A0ABP2EY31_AJEDR|nr:uncharacterized protein BDCG_04228 [Blastomyces dermatitidis ER-3]EEQ89108.1 hypothetical protein BDCG_04228 [Blastomyces dermatitidis ER-3]EQL31733.1 hypothetical protein BDFG_05963 [Blastomyces dermatitidis ATCC 26199]
MVLLTSSGISLAISTSIIGLFTLLLFLSGYVLQQQSVRGMQAALSPTAPTHPASRPYPVAGGSPAGAYVIVNQGKEAFSSPDVVVTDSGDTGEGRDGELGESSGYEGMNSRQDDQGSNYGQKHKQVYLQMVSRPSVSGICSSLLFFKTLASQSKITTDKVFLYPKSWDNNAPTRSIVEALSTLKNHQDVYDIIIHAIDMTDPNYRFPSNTKLLSKASHKLTHYEKIFFTRSPGMLLNASKLNQLFFSEPPTFSSSSSSSYSPLSSWKKRRKPNDNSQTDMWVPTRLSTMNADLPYAFLVTTDHDSSGRVSIRSHVPIPSVKQSLIVPAIPRFPAERVTELHPAYVFFDKSKNQMREMGTVYYQEWKKQVHDACQGIEIND